MTIPRLTPGRPLVGIRYRTPGDQRTDAALMVATTRAASERPALPAIGATVRFRPAIGAKVTTATVLAVGSLTTPELPEPDPNVWQRKTDSRGRLAVGWELVADPWPTLTLGLAGLKPKLAGGKPVTITREARIPGAAGWIPDGKE